VVPEVGQPVPVRGIVLDTNIVLDLFIFSDPATHALRAALDSGNLRWIATTRMRDELERVLTYAHLVPRMAFYEVSATDVLAQFDRLVHRVDPAPRASAVCKDPDDQVFIDLAVAHQVMLLSKDKAVTSMKKRLLALGVIAQTAIKIVA
jgi:putative PIN family toxin of toxin-antitoxin system